MSFLLLHLNSERYSGLRRYRREDLHPELQQQIDIFSDLMMPYGMTEDALAQKVRFALDLDYFQMYLPVARVEASELHAVFQLTNNIHSSWIMNPGVTLTKNRKREANENANKIRAALAKRGESTDGVEPSLRSTSVGDVVIAPDGVYYCNSIGWLKVDVDPKVIARYEGIV